MNWEAGIEADTMEGCCLLFIQCAFLYRPELSTRGGIAHSVLDPSTSTNTIPTVLSNGGNVPFSQMTPVCVKLTETKPSKRRKQKDVKIRKK